MILTTHRFPGSCFDSSSQRPEDGFMILTSATLVNSKPTQTTLNAPRMAS